MFSIRFNPRTWDYYKIKSPNLVTILFFKNGFPVPANPRLCKALRDCARSSKFPVFERGRGWQRGFWRLVMARFSGTELLVMVQTATVSGEEKEELVSEIKAALTQDKGGSDWC